MDHIHRLSAADRWRQNVPVTNQEMSQARGRLMMLAVVVLVGLTAAAVTQWRRVSHVTISAQKLVTEPEHAAAKRVHDGKIPLVVFTQPGCLGCVEFHQAEAHGAFPEAQVVYVRRDQNTGWRFDHPELSGEFARLIPIGPIAPGLGPKHTRPTDAMQFGCPAFWIPGSKVYWSGYTPDVAGHLRGWIIHTAANLPDPPQASFESHIQIGKAGVSAIINASPNRQHRDGEPLYQSALPPEQRTAPVEQSDGQAAEPLYPEDFVGVAVVITIAELTDVLPSIRKTISDRGDRSLQALVNQHLGDRVQARLVTEVAKPNLYRAIQEAAGTSAEKSVAVHVLVPETKQGLIKGFVLARLQSLLAEHVMPQVRSFPLAEVNVVLQRIHGGAYEQLYEVVQHPPEEAPPIDGQLPSGFLQNGIAALITERFKILRKLRNYFWPPKAELEVA